jgi:two-component system sensor histidine kinase UhpB
VHPSVTLPLYWRVVLTNGVVFLVGTVALALSPATVSTRVLQSEAVVLAIGLGVILVVNALLLRRSLAPLDRLTDQMSMVESPAQGQRLPEQGTGVVAELVASYNAMLDRLENERSASNARALAAQEGERQRIAQELHDEIGQTLTVVLLALKRVVDNAPPELVDELASIQTAVRNSMVEVRRVARRLRPGVLNDLGLFSALSALATEMTKDGEIHVRRAFAPGLPAVDDETELVIYRVAQEALTNVRRHAEARTVELALSKQGEHLLLRVADDGRGLGHAAAGAGILGMRERAHLVDGALELRTGELGGTEVRLVVPITRPTR